jgi:putative ABC transport system permease protein
MEVLPILTALKRSKTGAVLVVLQIALTLAIISNVLSIIGERTALIMRPTGTDEPNLFAVGFRLTHATQDKAALTTDLRGLRALPNVLDVVASNTFPLRGTGWAEGISRSAGDKSIQEQSAQTAVYAMDRHAVGTLGLNLLRGRNFTDEDAIDGNFNAGPMPSIAIVSKALEQKLYPQGDALGQVVYLTADARKPITIIGVVDRLQSATAAGTVDPSVSENSIILPIHGAGASGMFIVRVKPGTIEATMPEVRKALVAINPDRLFGRLRPFGEVRREAYEKDRSLAIALGIVCGVLVLVTSLGIVGLTSFWVARRKRQIGIRRALGASRFAIVRYFLVENALLCTGGVLLGTFAAQVVNLWLWSHYGVDRLPVSELLVCAVVVLTLGQGAALCPALRAAKVPPTEALRSM